MKAILEFNLPDDQEDLDDSLAGRRWRFVVTELDNWLRSCLKYGHNYGSANAALEQARSHLRGAIEDEKLSLD